MIPLLPDHIDVGDWLRMQLRDGRNASSHACGSASRTSSTVRTCASGR